MSSQYTPNLNRTSVASAKKWGRSNLQSEKKNVIYRTCASECMLQVKALSNNSVLNFCPQLDLTISLLLFVPVAPTWRFLWSCALM
jgi:hypothetical protein